MEKIFTFLLVFVSFFSLAQTINPENLTKKETLYWDFKKTQLQASGAYFQDELSVTTEKHGQWLYYNRLGQLEEERNYYRDKLNGKVVLYHPSKKLKQEGYFKLDQQDSVYREWNEMGKLTLQGTYKLDQKIGEWKEFYSTGKEKSVSYYSEKEPEMRAFWLADSAHTQTIINGNGELKSFYTTGQLKEWYRYKNGLKNGAFEERSTYGYPTLTGFFKNGQKDCLHPRWR